MSTLVEAKEAFRLIPNTICHNGVPPVDYLTFFSRYQPDRVLPYAALLENPDIEKVGKDQIDIYSLKPGEIIPALMPTIRNELQLGQLSLWLEHNGRFNLHEDQHAAEVAINAGKLLKMAGIDDDTAHANAEIAGVLHDGGNYASRKWHHLTSVKWALEKFPQLREDKQRRGDILKAILHHNEAHYREPWFEDKTFEEQIDILSEIHSPVSSAIVIADKNDFGRSRVPWRDDTEFARKARTRDGIQYPHYALNWVIENEGVSLSPDGSQFVLHMAFNPYLSKGQELYSPELIGERAGPDVAYTYVPDYLQDTQGTADVAKSWGLLWNLYGPSQKTNFSRISLTAASAFNLFPDIKGFTMRLSDKLSDDVLVEETFTRENADMLFAQYAQLYGNSIAH